MRKCTAKKGEFSCTVWGSPWCKDCAKYKPVNVKHHYKNIEEALKVERPHDHIGRIINNKFAIVYTALLGGNWTSYGQVCGLEGDGKIYFYGTSLDGLKNWIKQTEELPNIKKRWICYEHPKNGKREHWLYKTQDHRRYKQIYRRLKKSLNW